MPPAARITDLHVCPVAAGPVVTGESTVLVGYLPAARVGDQATCGSGKDGIETGEPSVLIGYKDAARIGDMTTNGGTITTGFPSVLIGDPVEKTPCDIETLEVVATVQGPKPKVRRLSTSERLRGGPIACEVSGEVQRLLKEYDLVIDAVADYTSEADADPLEKVELVATSTYYGKCSVFQHPKMMLTPRSAVEALPEPILVRQAALPKREFYAASSVWDWDNFGGGLGVIIQIIGLMWPDNSTSLLEVESFGCGVRKDGKDAKIRLNTLVRIFRKDDWKISLSIPPLFSRSRERSKTMDLRNGDVTTERSVTTKPMFGRDASGSTYSTTTGGSAVQGGNEWKRGQDGKVTGSEFQWRADGTPEDASWTPQADGFGRAFDPGSTQDLRGVSDLILKITHNGQELEVSKVAIKKLFETFKKLMNFVEEFRKLLDKLPQVGGKITFEYAFLEGSVEGAWKPEMVDEAVAGRYLPVRTQFTLEIKLLLVMLKLEGSFGLDVQLAFSNKLVCKVALELKFELPFSVSIPTPTSKFSVDLKPELTGKVEGRAEVEVFGWSLIDAKAGVEAGISAAVTFSVDPKPELNGTVTRKRIVFKAHYKSAWGSPKSYTHEFWPEKDIFKFPEPKEPRAPGVGGGASGSR